MASHKLSLFSLSLCFFLLCHGSLAQIEQIEQIEPFRGQGQQRQSCDRTECRIQNLNAQEPTRRFESEAGVEEYWDENNEQFQCAGVAAARYTIEPRGLLLPEFANAPRLVYIVQGRGISGAIFPGCPESFQSFQQSQRQEEGGSQRYRDQHQKIQHFRQGDIIAYPAGVAHWAYNDGDSPIVAVTVLDTSSSANQLDQNLRKFHLAGNQQQQSKSSWAYQHESRGQQEKSNNIFRGFDLETLAEAFGVRTETVRKIQGQEDRRGRIVHVVNGLQVVRPPKGAEEEEERRYSNGLEETYCNMRLRENIADPTSADVYSPQGGRINNVNGQKLPILNYIQMSAEKGVLYRNALLAPQWNMNAHSVIYVTRGNGRVQIVDNKGNRVFDGQLHDGQMVIVPQMFAVVKQAGEQGLEYIAFKTNDNAITNPLAGKASAIRGLPEDVIVNSYRISREEARRLKYNRGEEMKIFGPRYSSQPRASAA